MRKISAIGFKLMRCVILEDFYKAENSNGSKRSLKKEKMDITKII
jgi:hypothetical protein